MSAPTSKSVQWVPINLTEGGQGCLACPALLLRGSHHQRPARGVKLPTSHRAIAHSHREPALGLILTDLLKIRNTISSAARSCAFRGACPLQVDRKPRVGVPRRPLSLETGGSAGILTFLRQLRHSGSPNPFVEHSKAEKPAAPIKKDQPIWTPPPISASGSR